MYHLKITEMIHNGKRRKVNKTTDGQFDNPDTAMKIASTTDWIRAASIIDSDTGKEHSAIDKDALIDIFSI